MLTRRGFTGFASCALCAITGFVATEASAQGAPAASSGGVTRKILSQTDGPAPGYVTVLVEAEIEAGFKIETPKREPKPKHQVQKFDDIEYERVFGKENILTADFRKLVGAC